MGYSLCAMMPKTPQIISQTSLVLFFVQGLTGLITLKKPVSSNMMVYVCLGDFARFQCSSNISTSRLFWLINGTFVNALPEEYEISYSVYHSETRKLSTMQILAIKETNNSVVTCAAGISNRISNFSTPVFLRVLRLPLPPVDLTIEIVDTSMPIVTLTWQHQDNSDNEIDSIMLYQLSAINATTSEILSTIYTNLTQYTHINISIFFNDNNDCNISSIVFYVRAIRFQPMTCLSVKSETVGLPNTSSITKFCQDAESAATIQSHCSAYIIYAVEFLVLAVFNILNYLHQFLGCS